MKRKFSWDDLFIILISFVLISLDQLTKFFINSKFNGIGLFIFKIKSVFNTGAAFSFLDNISWFIIVIIVISIIVAIACIYFYIKFRKQYKNKKPKSLFLVNAGLLLLFSGTIGNLIDRIYFGYVRDFLTLIIPFPIFNLADLLNIAGAILLVVYFIRHKSL